MCNRAAVFVQKAAVELPNPPEVIASAYRLTKTKLRVLLALVQLGGGRAPIGDRRAQRPNRRGCRGCMGCNVFAVACIGRLIDTPERYGDRVRR
jgi:hypothetical protein